MLPLFLGAAAVRGAERCEGSLGGGWRDGCAVLPGWHSGVPGGMAILQLSRRCAHLPVAANRSLNRSPGSTLCSCGPACNLPSLMASSCCFLPFALATLFSLISCLDISCLKACLPLQTQSWSARWRSSASCPFTIGRRQGGHAILNHPSNLVRLLTAPQPSERACWRAPQPDSAPATARPPVLLAVCNQKRRRPRCPVPRQRHPVCDVRADGAACWPHKAVPCQAQGGPCQASGQLVGMTPVQLSPRSQPDHACATRPPWHAAHGRRRTFLFCPLAPAGAGTGWASAPPASLCSTRLPSQPMPP